MKNKKSCDIYFSCFFRRLFYFLRLCILSFTPCDWFFVVVQDRVRNLQFTALALTLSRVTGTTLKSPYGAYECVYELMSIAMNTLLQECLHEIR